MHRVTDLKPISDGVPRRGKVVLVVEDEPMIRLALCTHLEEKGFQIREAACAADAITILQEPGCPINIVFSDVRMPGKWMASA